MQIAITLVRYFMQQLIDVCLKLDFYLLNGKRIGICFFGYIFTWNELNRIYPTAEMRLMCLDYFQNVEIRLSRLYHLIRGDRFKRWACKP